MAAYTVIELLERARTAADMVGSNFVTPTEWVRWLNVENRWLTRFLAQNGYVLAVSRDDFTGGSTINSFGEATLANPIAVIGVYELTDGSRYRRIRHSDVMDGAGFKDLVTTGPATSFTLIQNPTACQIKFWPIPTSGTYQVFYIAEPATLTTASSVNYPSSIEELLVLKLARRALAKEESDTREISRQIAEATSEVESLCWDRVMAGHQKVRNVDRVERGWFDDPMVATRERWYWV